MKKTAVVFWSGTGNTESMANAVLEGMKAAGAEAELFTSEQADSAKLAGFDAIAFGCPAMGAEELEETEFAPMFDAVKGSLSGKDAALFGSYGWGDGEWIRGRSAFRAVSRASPGVGSSGKSGFQLAERLCTIFRTGRLGSQRRCS